MRQHNHAPAAPGTSRPKTRPATAKTYPPVCPPSIADFDEFDMYGWELELGDWSYGLDDYGIIYGPGWYPFHRDATTREPHPSHPLTDISVPTGRTYPAQARLSPDVENRSWCNEYVLVRPYDHRVQAQLQLFVEKRGMGAMVRSATVEIDLRAATVTIPDECPPHLEDQATVKARRVLELLKAARSERRRGLGTPFAVLCPHLRSSDQ